MASSLELDDGGQPAQSLLTFAKFSLNPLTLGNVNPARVQERDLARSVTDGMHREVNDALAAVSYPVPKLFAENVPRGGLLSCEAYPRLYLLRAAPPLSIAERAVQNLFPCIPTPLQG